MKITMIIVGIGLIVLLSLVIIQMEGVKEKTISETDSVKNNSEEMQEVDSISGEVENVSEENSYLNTSENTDLVAVGDYTGDGEAVRAFNGERFFHTVTANVVSPAEGKFYEGWLVDGASFFSTGKMIEKDGQYYLEYFSEEDQRNFNQVVITEETLANGLDGQPEAHVLEGSF